jgi:hypothetical protein
VYQLPNAPALGFGAGPHGGSPDTFGQWITACPGSGVSGMPGRITGVAGVARDASWERDSPWPWRGRGRRGRGRCERGRFGGADGPRGIRITAQANITSSSVRKTRNQKRPSLTRAAWVIAAFWPAVASLTGPAMPGPGTGANPAPVMPGSGTDATVAYPATLGLYRALTGFRRTLGKVILGRVATATIRTLPERLATALTK